VYTKYRLFIRTHIVHILPKGMNFTRKDVSVESVAVAIGRVRCVCL